MDNLSDSCFAYPSMRKYPIHTKEAALNSNKDFQKEASQYPKPLFDMITANFAKAAAYHEIQYEKQEKQAAAPAETIDFKGGVTMSKIASADDVNSAVKWILEKRASVERKNLAEAAKYTLWHAANREIDLETPEMRKLARIAGIGVGNRSEIEHELEKRATLSIFDGKDHDEFWKFASEMKNLSDDDFYTEENLNKLANLLEEIDTLYGNTANYGKSLAYPEDVVFSNNMGDLLKQAQDLLLVPSIDTTISKSALLERGNKVNAFFRNYFGAEKDLGNDEIISKVASLDAKTAKALLEEIA